MADALFRRRIKTSFPVAGVSFLYTENSGIYQVFAVPFGTGKNAEIGTVSLYNLKKATIEKIVRDDPVIIEAAYAGLQYVEEPPLKQIMAGVITKVVSVWKGPDKITTVSIGDGTDKWLSKRVNRSWEPGVKASTVAKDLAEATGLPVGKLEIKDDFEYETGFTATASATIKEELDRVLGDIESNSGVQYDLHVARGYIVFKRDKEEWKHSGVLISAKHGLLGHVSEIVSDQPSQDTGTVPKQYSLVSLLQPDIFADMLVDIESEDANGTFRVVEGKHAGSGEGAFETSLVVEEHESAGTAESTSEASATSPEVLTQ